MQTINNIILYFFNPVPGTHFNYYPVIIGIIVILVALSIFIPIHIKRNKDDKAFKKLFRVYPSKLQLVGIIFTLYVLSRLYSVPFFSMRFMLYILLGVTAFLIYHMVKTYLNKYPEEKKRRNERDERNKYLVKKKKKKNRR